MSMKQPVTQVRLTNIAVVRYRMGGKRFEIACFPNKVIDWRNKIETDLNRVLQSHEVFNNVSKADIANSKELLEAFDTTDRMYICRLILSKGEMQVSEAERKRDHEMRQREIIAFVVNMCINYETRLPFPARMIENAMHRVHFAVHPTRSTKQQALELIKLLKDDGALPIERAQMRIRVTASDKAWLEAQAQRKATGGKGPIPASSRPSIVVRKSIASLWTALESEDLTEGFEGVMLVPPSSFRLIVELVMEATSGSGSVEVIDSKVDESDMKALDALAAGGGHSGGGGAAAGAHTSVTRDEVDDEVAGDGDERKSGSQVSGRKKPSRKVQHSDDRDDNAGENTAGTDDDSADMFGLTGANAKAARKLKVQQKEDAKRLARQRGSKAKGAKGGNGQDEVDEDDMLSKMMSKSVDDADEDIGGRRRMKATGAHGQKQDKRRGRSKKNGHDVSDDDFDPENVDGVDGIEDAARNSGMSRKAAARFAQERALLRTSTHPLMSKKQLKKQAKRQAKARAGVDSEDEVNAEDRDEEEEEEVTSEEEGEEHGVEDEEDAHDDDEDEDNDVDVGTEDEYHNESDEVKGEGAKVNKPRLSHSGTRAHDNGSDGEGEDQDDAEYADALRELLKLSVSKKSRGHVDADESDVTEEDHATMQDESDTYGPKAFPARAKVVQGYAAAPEMLIPELDMDLSESTYSHNGITLSQKGRVVFEQNGLRWSMGGDSSDEDF